MIICLVALNSIILHQLPPCVYLYLNNLTLLYIYKYFTCKMYNNKLLLLKHKTTIMTTLVVAYIIQRKGYNYEALGRTFYKRNQSAGS